MTGNERITRILEGRSADRISWTTLVDDTTRSVMDGKFREMPVFDFYRYIGCDILQFGDYGLPEEQRALAYRHLTPEAEEKTLTDSAGRLTRTWTTRWGTLTAIFQTGHPVKYPVETLQDLRVLKNIWLHSRIEETGGMGEPYRRLEEQIGEDGRYIPTVEPSVIQRLLQYEMGMVNFYYLLQDHREEVEELFEIMHRCRLQEYEITARRTPAPVIIPVENTSSTLISPALYERYSLPQVRDFVSVAHRYGKKAILHMCGCLKALLPLIKETGLDGIHALTPAPVGDTGFEEAWKFFGDKLVVIGCLDADIFQNPATSPGDIERYLEKVCTPKIRCSPIILIVTADGLATPLDRFLAVRDWMAQHG